MGQVSLHVKTNSLGEDEYTLWLHWERQQGEGTVVACSLTASSTLLGHLHSSGVVHGWDV